MIAVVGTGWLIDEGELIPDVVVADDPGDVDHITGTPHLAVEVLSSDRSRGTVLKHQKYAAVGLERYWIIDPDGPTIMVHHLVDGDYREVEAHQPGKKMTLDVGPAEITLDPAHLVD